MEKKKYSTPAVSVMALQQQDMLCGSPGSMGIHDEYTDAEQLSNRNIWDGFGNFLRMLSFRNSG